MRANRRLSGGCVLQRMRREPCFARRAALSARHATATASARTIRITRTRMPRLEAPGSPTLWVAAVGGGCSLRPHVRTGDKPAVQRTSSGAQAMIGGRPRARATRSPMPSAAAWMVRTRSTQALRRTPSERRSWPQDDYIPHDASADTGRTYNDIRDRTVGRISAANARDPAHGPAIYPRPPRGLARATPRASTVHRAGARHREEGGPRRTRRLCSGARHPASSVVRVCSGCAGRHTPPCVGRKAGRSRSIPRGCRFSARRRTRGRERVEAGAGSVRRRWAVRGR
jgi:hypothetical protein